ncbi:MAG: sugar phosphate isomerase/epimerase [Bacteroidota bacterium]|nr:sugar phosphate isomerase/epimerase [Bacteroidota bacterium]
MPYTRKDFLKTATTGIALTAITGKILGYDSTSAFGSSKKLNEFGLQLYTVRDVMPKDPKGVLKQVAAMGYKQVESFEGPMGMFWGMKNTEFKKYMDDLGMKIISSHCNIDKDFDRKANEAAEIGMKYLIDPYFGTQKNIDLFKKVAEKFNQRGETCKKAGLRFAYHNHDYPFVPVDGQKLLDVMIQNTDPNLVDFEMDIYWVVTAGEDPIKWFEKYPNRFRLSHIKDRKKGSPLSDKDASCVAGKGEIDFSKILKIGQKNGLKYYIVEQEHYDGITSLEASKENADYLKKLEI